MRATLVSVAFLIAASSASAQDTAPPETGLGPYHFGMSLAEIEATSQHAQWRVSGSASASQVLEGGPQVQVGGARFAARFVFNNEALSFIVLDAHASSACATSVRSLIEQDLEPSFGAFNSAFGPSERGSLINTSTTARGSEIREIIVANGDHALFSAHRGAVFFQVKGVTQPDGSGCAVSLILNAQAPYAGPLLAPLDYAELDRASSLPNPSWITRASARTFERYYPNVARDHDVEGSAGLDCIVDPDGLLRCLVSYETPTGASFGEAALHIARDFRVLRNNAGVPAPGKRVRVAIAFRLSGGSGCAQC